MHGHHRVRLRGFTLIELLVAIAIMALMAVLSWRGLDGISRTQVGLQQRTDDVMALQATLAQWGADLDAMETQPNFKSIEWDGRAFRVLRRSRTAPEKGLLVVAWSRRNLNGQSQWLRWQSPPLSSRDALELAWQKAAQWGQNPSEDDRLREVPTVPIDQWQIFYYRGNAWTNPLSSAGNSADAVNGLAPVSPTATVTPNAADDIPQGVRLVLYLSEGQGISGKLTRDWVRPVLGGSP